MERESAGEEGAPGSGAPYRVLSCIDGHIDRWMGLKSADYGVKSDLQKRASSAFQRHQSLAAMRKEVGLERRQAVATLDGNVLLRAVPMAVHSDAEYVHILVGNVRSALEAARTVVVVFDEPENMSVAKREEQARRDAAGQKAKVVSSFDFCSVPKDDSYTLYDIQTCKDAHALMDERGARARFIDHVCVQACKTISALLQRWTDAGHDAGAVLFDGVDQRGAERPFAAARVPGELLCQGGSVPNAAALLARDCPVGEGDLKIMAVERQLARLCCQEGEESCFHDVKIYIACTIDTDSFAIEILEEARRRSEGSEAAFCTVLCMRERPSKPRQDRLDAPFAGQAHYLCADVAMLTDWVANTVAPQSPAYARSAVALAVAGWAVAGCDFVSLKGARASVNLDAAAKMVRRNPEALRRMEAAWSGEKGATLDMQAVVHSLLREAGSLLEQNKRLKKSAASVACPPSDVLRRTAWTVAYWCGCEFKTGLDADFGFSPAVPECSADF